MRDDDRLLFVLERIAVTLDAMHETLKQDQTQSLALFQAMGPMIGDLFQSLSSITKSPINKPGPTFQATEGGCEIHGINVTPCPLCAADF